MSRKRAIIILSGGLDSAFNLYKAVETYQVVLALTFNYGQRAVFQEIRAAKALCEVNNVAHETLFLDWLSKLSSSSLIDSEKTIPVLNISDLDDKELTAASAQAVWVPNRNGLFLNMAACYAEVLKTKVIIAGFNYEEAQTFSDNTSEFLQAITQSFSYSTQIHPQVESFSQEMTKTKIVSESLKLKIPFELIWSCYEGGEKMCGVCESCLRLKRAYQNNKILEPYRYLFEI